MLESLLTFIGYDVPWQTWLIPSVASALIAFFVLRGAFGSRVALIGTVLMSIAAAMKVLDRRGRQAGWDERIKKEERDAADVVERAKRAELNVLGAGDKRLHDDDGFKRQE